jgi:hypothetical protein
MRAISIAIGLCFVAAAAVFGLTYPLTKSVEISYGVAGLPFVVCHHIAETLEQREARVHFALGKSASIKSLHTFAISWPLMTIFGTVILIVLSQAVGFLVGAAIAGAADRTTAFRSAALFFNVPAVMLIAFLLGRWIGARSRDHGLVAVIAIAVASAVLGHAFDYLVMSAKDFQATFGEEKTIQFFVFQVIATVIITVPPLLLGYWRGTRQRIYKYLQFLLAVIPEETRAVFVDLAVQEATSASLKKAHT